MRAGELARAPSLLLFWNAMCIYCPVAPSSSQEVIFSRARGAELAISPENFSTPPVRTLGDRGAVAQKRGLWKSKGTEPEGSIEDLQAMVLN